MEEAEKGVGPCPRHERFVERFARVFEDDGLPRTSGRMFALLLLSSEALCLDRLAELLQVSKASASTNARLLQRVGALERVSYPGDRRDFYRVGDDVAQRMLARRLERLQRVRAVVEEGREVLAGVEPGVRDRLQDICRLYGRAIEQLSTELDETGRRGSRGSWG